MDSKKDKTNRINSIGGLYMMDTIIDFFFYMNIIIAYITGAIALCWVIKISGLGVWLANTWLGELTRPLWEFEQDNE